MLQRIWLVILLLLWGTVAVLAQEEMSLAVASADVEVMSDGQAYGSYLSAPAEGGPYPGIVLIHSFNGLEQGYRDMTDQFAAHGFVVLAVGWQTFERSPSDETMAQLITDSITFLSERDDVDAGRLGLTGFCAGGRYTMRFLPEFDAFGAGVAWYGFPYGDGTQAADLVDELDAPMLMIHGTADEPSPIADIFQYATALADAGKSFELKVYQGEPHGFMLSDGQLRDDEVAQDAFDEMVRYFERKL